MKLILGSGSPRRKTMLADLGLKFTVAPADIDESVRYGESPLGFVMRLAEEKARAVASSKNIRSDYAILSADTIVVNDGKILGKPKNKIDAQKMLKSLSGQAHTVITAWCWLVWSDGEEHLCVKSSKTKVTFSERNREFWNWYVTTGEPMDKAGSYAAQGIGMSFIKRVSGSYSNVVGLPLSDVLESFTKLTGKDLLRVAR